MLIDVILQLVDRLERGRTVRTGKHLRRGRPYQLNLLQVLRLLAGTAHFLVVSPVTRIPESLLTAFLPTRERFVSAVHIFVVSQGMQLGKSRRTLGAAVN